MGTHCLDPQLLDALLKHPSITQDHQAVCALLATSKAIHTAVDARCSGQLSVQLTAGRSQRQKVLHFAAWLKQHGHLLQKLVMQLSEPGEFREYEARMRYDSLRWSNELGVVAAAMQQAGSTHPLLLQHFSLGGSAATPELLAALPASSLTSLGCEVGVVRRFSYPNLGQVQTLQDTCSTSLACIAQLTQLESLILGTHGPSDADTLQELSSLQHLTKLQLGEVDVRQLEQLPPNLQQLIVTLDVDVLEPGDAFTCWLRQHGGILVSLGLASVVPDPDDIGTALATVSPGLVDALQHAASESGSRLPLLDLYVPDVPLGSMVYEQLAASCALRSLCCTLYDSRSLVVIGSMTSLTSLSVNNDRHTTVVGVELQHLLGLTGLKNLHVGGVDAMQLQHLPTTLEELSVHSFLGEQTALHALSLGHLVCMTKLQLPTLGDDDVLPPNLVGFDVVGRLSTLQPLLTLQKLQNLGLTNCGTVEGQQLHDLTGLGTLTSLSLAYQLEKGCDCSWDDHTAAWAALPLRSLSVEERVIPDPVTIGLHSLHGLTKLDLQGPLPGDPNPPSLVKALHQLTALCILRLKVYVVATEKNKNNYYQSNAYLEHMAGMAMAVWYGLLLS